MNRSIERDFDINYATRSARQCMKDIEEFVQLVVDVDHTPVPLLRALNEQWMTLIERHGPI